MKTWFIRHHNESHGPYTIEELKNLSLSEDDYIWKEGLADWVQADSIPELSQLFAGTPPPFAAHNNSSRAASFTTQSTDHSYFASAGKQNKTRRNFVWTGIVLILCFVTYLIYATNQSGYVSPFSSGTQKPAEELRADLAQTEKQNPSQYISGRTGNRQNLLNQTVLEGTLTNSATIAVFKDIELQVDFLSKTNSVITSQNFTVYEVINPGQTISFKKKTFVSKDVVSVHVTITNAIPVN